MRDLRRLVILDYLLGGPGERWQTLRRHLAEKAQITARAILEPAAPTPSGPRTLEDTVQQASRRR